tara:strand:+ start:388 stop:840 length:453 start_codon:yes stop_codon:yes gene_type:complete
MDKIGFIGLGNMGRPLAERLIKKYKLYTYDLEKTNLQYFTHKGAVACSSPSEVASKVNQIFLCLPTSSIVETVVNGDNGLAISAKKGAYIIDMTTGEPEITRKISDKLKEKEINFIDASKWWSKRSLSRKYSYNDRWNRGAIHKNKTNNG